MIQRYSIFFKSIQVHTAMCKLSLGVICLKWQCPVFIPAIVMIKIRVKGPFFEGLRIKNTFCFKSMVNAITELASEEQITIC